ncbi:MAG: tRNA uridine 5-carboxymethylaminomethyl modification protein GidA [Candidatus Tyloplasma litorale]|nr:MAG: tRNA uridine 5-carboxymethylaminomethyl modification protein GidA [Mycoplasmatales bacterium]
MKHIIIVGSGHAGVEAAHFANKLGNKVTLVTFNENDIAHLPCNVSIGGSAKGIVVKELFALGGIMPIAADETQLQTKILNKSKGPAVQALRAQVDKLKYPLWMKNYILNSKINLKLGKVQSLIIDKNDEVKGVVFDNGEKLKGDAVIIATGTFLRSKTMKGKDIKMEGPDGKETSKGISEQLNDFGIELIRLKTGTPPRIKKDSIDFSNLEEEPGSSKPIFFSEDIKIKKKYQNIPAWLAYTNEKTHEIIKNNFDKSYLFSTEITGSGPRYCPSIEDKVKRFHEKKRHQIFLELESEELNTIYMAGISSSLPKDVQEQFVRTIKGFENAEFEKYAYAIEYDSINPTQLKQTLELKRIPSLYFAGQVNGTSGYEEAAAQGMIAAINASNKLQNKKDFILNRNESYIGVMIDDITTKGIDDPYRLLSSRAEYRLLLRTDNAVKRLYKKAFDNKLISQERYELLETRYTIFEKMKKKLWEARLNVADERFSTLLKNKNIHLNVNSVPLIDMIKRPEFKINELKEFIREQIEESSILTDNDLITLGIEIKFAGYIKKQEREVSDYLRYQKLELSSKLNYDEIPNLALEAKEKLNKFKPRSIHQAKNIQGINPADIMNLVAYLNK